jgi:hypothetical protein
LLPRSERFRPVQGGHTTNDGRLPRTSTSSSLGLPFQLSGQSILSELHSLLGVNLLLVKVCEGL